MSGFLPPDNPRFTVDRDASGYVVLDSVRKRAGTDPALVSGIETQATAANIVTALNWHWHWVLDPVAAPEMSALAELLKTARKMHEELERFSFEPWVACMMEYVDPLGEALKPFAHLEVPDDRQAEDG